MSNKRFPSPSAFDSAPVVVLGAGFAGLAAAVYCRDAGHPVVVLEARKRLGGRATSFVDRVTGDEVDNGQHALMGCYHETLRFLQHIGASDKLVRQPRLSVPYVDMATGRRAYLQAGRGPSPLHVAQAILSFQLLPLADRLKALAGGLRCLLLHRRRDPSLSQLTVTELLMLCGQSEVARTKLWYPIALATLNEHPERAAAAPFVEVLARAFFAGARDSQFVFPRVPLRQFYVDDASSYLQRTGASIQTRAIAERLVVDGEHVLAVRLRDGNIVPASAVICALPVEEAGRLLGPLGVHVPPPQHSPIVSVHLWFEQPTGLPPFVGLLGTHTQWVFDRTGLWQCEHAGTRSGHYLAGAVMSAAYEEVDWPEARLVDIVQRELRLAFPHLGRLRHASVVREKRATPSLTPRFERQRPSTITKWTNLLLAGDWVRTGLPATIESAVTSARAAAHSVARARARA